MLLHRSGARRAALTALVVCALSAVGPAARAQSLAGIDAGAAPLDASAAYVAPAPPADSGADAAFPWAPGVQSGPFAPPDLAYAQPVDVTVVGLSKAQRTRESAQAVTVVEMEDAKRQSADLGEVLARVQGVHVRRQGGLGSSARFSLNGLTDDQVRFYLDDVPLELAGFSQGIANVPTLPLERVVVYRGVVPVRFGADALGGLVNMISSHPTWGKGAGASYQVGSFGTHRGAGYAYNVHRPTGLFTRVTLYADYARNDYEVEVPVTVDNRLDRVKRFHDGYRALGGAVEVGFVKRPWAKRLILRGFGMRMDKELQHSPINMVSPYGEAKFDRSNYGATLRYEQPLVRDLFLEAWAGYSYQPTNFYDETRWIYDWYGQRVRPDSNPGETSDKAVNQLTYEHATFARSVLTWRVAEGHKLVLASSPTHTLRSGEDRLITMGRDPLADERRLLAVVTGLSYELNLFEDVLENTLFGKSYVYRTSANDIAPNGVAKNSDRSVTRFGVGDALRLRLTRTLYSKLSYELATRLPRPIEVFGDGVQVRENLRLAPETSHNGNLELTLASSTESAGRFRASANAFLRKTKNQILPFGFRRSDLRYENVYRATSRGVEGNAGWASPGDYLELDGSVTYIDLRNESSEGAFGRFEGDRVPNRPYLFASTTTRAMLRELFADHDELALTWYMRYTHDFYRSWESAGKADTKQQISAQWFHALVLGYLTKLDKLELSGTLEAHNIADAELFDNFGIQRPGRAYYFKLTAER